jgi:hypothetical protein
MGDAHLAEEERASDTAHTPADRQLKTFFCGEKRTEPVAPSLVVIQLPVRFVYFMHRLRLESVWKALLQSGPIWGDQVKPSAPITP